MSNKIVLKKSSVALKVPTAADLDYGEVALNYADGKLYFKNSSNIIQPVSDVYTKVTANTTALINQGYLANTSGGTFTITLPASPQIGNYVIIVDDNNFSTNPLYVGRNGNLIAGAAQDLTLDIQGVSVTLLYDGTQWNAYTQVGASGGSATTGVYTTDTGTVTNTMLAGSIANSKLANSSVTIGSTSISLGGTSTTLSGITTLSIAGGATVTNNSSTDKYLAIGTKGQLFDDGNLHIHSSSGNVWINSLDGGSINLGLQSNSGTSSVNANNLGLNAGYGSIAPVYGVRAWINCGYVASAMTTRASGNLSVTRTAVGVYTFTFGTAMPDGNYAINAMAQTPGSNSDCAVNITNGTTPSTTGFSLTVARYGNGNEDTPILHVQVVR